MIAWTADDPATGDKYLALFNAGDAKEVMEEKAIWSSGVINKQTPAQSKMVDVDITGAKKLYLAVSDAGDNIEWDYADWIDPVLYKGADTQSLTSLKWVKAKAGWGRVRLNKSVSGNDLMVNGKKYAAGIGTHATSVIEYDLPEGCTRFTAMAGLDNAGSVQNAGSTVKFLVFTKDPSGPLPADSVQVPVQLKALGFNRACVIKDLWTGKQAGIFTGEFAPVIRRHGAGFYRISSNKS